MNFAEGAQTVSSFKFAGRGQMLDGRVLGASQVEYKPFGKPPLKFKRERCASPPRGCRAGLGREFEVCYFLTHFHIVPENSDLCFRASHSCPASEASIPSAPHSCRATCPASEPPACQARAKVGILPRKKMSRLSSKPTTSAKIFSSCPVGGQLSKVSANLPGRAAPARRHGGTQLMSRTNYEAVADFAGHWLHRAQVSLLTGEIGQIKLSHIRKNPGAGLARAWRGPGAGLACKVAHGL